MGSTVHRPPTCDLYVNGPAAAAILQSTHHTRTRTRTSARTYTHTQTHKASPTESHSPLPDAPHAQTHEARSDVRCAMCDVQTPTAHKGKLRHILLIEIIQSVKNSGKETDQKATIVAVL